MQNENIMLFHVHGIARMCCVGRYVHAYAKKNQDWFDPNDQELHILMSRRDQAHQRVLQTRSSRSTTAAYKDACRLLKKHTRALKSDWWERKAVELQRAADRNDMKGFYSGLKEVWGPKKKGPVQLKSTDEMETFSDSKRVVQDGVNTSRSYSTSLAT